jgi:hypothetical protein
MCLIADALDFLTHLLLAEPVEISLVQSDDDTLESLSELDLTTKI